MLSSFTDWPSGLPDGEAHRSPPAQVLLASGPTLVRQTVGTLGVFAYEAIAFYF